MMREQSGSDLGIGRTLAVTVVAFIGLAIPIYSIFYGNHPYDSDTGQGTDAFKLGFTVAFIIHLVITFIISVGLARFLGARKPIVAVAATIPVILILGLGTASCLSNANDCIGVSYPMPSSCITQEGGG